MDNKALVSLPGTLDYQELTLYYDRSRLEKAPPKAGRINTAISDTFDLVGGVPRLAVWADQNYGEFATKLLPRIIQSQQATEHSGEITIRTAIPRSPLDGVEFEDVTP
jgi:hypothetical protein